MFLQGVCFYGSLKVWFVERRRETCDAAVHSVGATGTWPGGFLC